MRPEAILVAGPTASGKSALAIAVAEAAGGIVVNADSMQVYRDLRILTARPSHEDEARVPHRLFGHVDGAEAYSVARWLADVAAVLGECRQAGRVPVIVGGTGLYFKALLEGLSDVPPIAEEVRAFWRRAAARLAPGELHARLAARDAEMARRLAPTDLQRQVRALEVLDATGRSLAAWQRQPSPPLLATAATRRLVIDVDREAVRARCDARFDAMVAAGALDEVAALAARRLDPALPVMRAIGVRPLLAALRGELTLAAAVAEGKLETRQYVKRQSTWLKRHMMSWNSVNSQQMESCRSDILALVGL